MSNLEDIAARGHAYIDHYYSDDDPEIWKKGSALTSVERRKRDRAIMRARWDGLSVAAISERFGLSKDAVYKIIDTHGNRDSHRRPRRRSVLSAADRAKIKARQERNTQIVDAYKNGESAASISLRLSINKTTVYDVLTVAGVSRSDQKPCVERNAAIISAYKSGASSYAIGEEHGLTGKAVMDIIHKAGAQRTDGKRNTGGGWGA